MSLVSNTSAKLLRLPKYLALLLIAFGIPTFFLDKAFGAEIPLLVGLFILLVSAEKIQDERVAQLKVTSLYFAFVISYAVKLLTSNFFDNGWISFELVEINHFLILMLALANSIFYARLLMKF
jgi:hypothetical protein